MTFMEPAGALVDKIKSAIQGQGGTFNGTVDNGIFQVSILLGSLSGSYTITGQQIDISIDSKPIFVSCNQIESFLKSKFST